LETVHREGGSYGRPGAMLSAGNLNTAALTLFLSLHLSVKPELPWLLLDDPVQSMDELHVAQFAALLRTLAKRERRQLIIAIHERQLFEYLSLELSPAFVGDKLITIEVSKSPEGSTRYSTNVVGFEPDRLVA
jgi:exonuclease SbcC